MGDRNNFRKKIKITEVISISHMGNSFFVIKAHTTKNLLVYHVKMPPKNIIIPNRGDKNPDIIKNSKSRS